MLIECPECGAKNQSPQPPQAGKRYRCGKCGASITFLQTDDTPVETTSIPTRQRTGGIVTDTTPSKGHSSAIPKDSIVPFESGHSRAQWVSVFLAAIVILDIVAVWSDYVQVQLINRMIRGDFFTMAEAFASDNRQAAIGFIYLVLFIITGILFLMWIHRAHRNLPSLGSTNLKYSPGWAVGWFFIPIFSLWKPYQVTTEIWKASDPTTNINDSTAWQKSPASSIVSSWWFLFIISAFIGNIVIRLYLRAETPSEILAASWWGLIMDAIDIPAAILAILVVRNIDERQQMKSQPVKTPLTF